MDRSGNTAPSVFFLLTTMGMGIRSISEYYQAYPDSRHDLWWMIPLGLGNGWALSQFLISRGVYL